jgi:hypothetical protein
MKLFRQSLILSHRYLGIVISLLVVVWFASGIVMMYAGGMPRLAPELRLERLPDIDLSRVHLTLTEAAQKAGFEADAGWDGRVTLLMILNRPVYRFAGGPAVFADTGEEMDALSLEQAKTVASRFMAMPEDKLRHVRTLTEPDQWTLGQGRQMPQYKFAADDSEGTELYVPAKAGEVTLFTTHESRLLAWLGVIPHWLYFSALRVNQPLWYQIVVWTSTLACALGLMGLCSAGSNSAGRSRFGGPPLFLMPAGCAGTTSPAWYSACSRSLGLSPGCCRWSPMNGLGREACRSRTMPSPAARSS